MYKRYMVFEFSNYGEEGGLHDCRNSFDSAKEAITYIKTKDVPFEHYQLFDRFDGVQMKLYGIKNFTQLSGRI